MSIKMKEKKTATVKCEGLPSAMRQTLCDRYGEQTIDEYGYGDELSEPEYDSSHEEEHYRELCASKVTEIDELVYMRDFTQNLQTQNPDLFSMLLPQAKIEQMRSALTEVG
jgi:hypothetical protein